jgi:hypothetical protein
MSLAEHWYFCAGRSVKKLFPEMDEKIRALIPLQFCGHV